MSGCPPCPQPPSHSCRALVGGKMTLKALTPMHIYRCECVLVCSCEYVGTHSTPTEPTHPHAPIQQGTCTHPILHSVPPRAGSPRLFIGRTRTATFTLVPLMTDKHHTNSDGRERQLINSANKSKGIEFYTHIGHTPEWPQQGQDID